MGVAPTALMAAMPVIFYFEILCGQALMYQCANEVTATTPPSVHATRRTTNTATPSWYMLVHAGVGYRSF